MSVVSHLVAGLELLPSDCPFWSPSLLLYKGRDEGALMSGVVDWDGEETAGFEDTRWSSMLVVILSTELVEFGAGQFVWCAGSMGSTLGQSGLARESFWGEVRESKMGCLEFSGRLLASDWPAPSWLAWICTLQRRAWAGMMVRVPR